MVFGAVRRGSFKAAMKAKRIKAALIRALALALSREPWRPDPMTADGPKARRRAHGFWWVPERT